MSFTSYNILQIAFFPEACDFLADNKKDIVAMAEPLTGQTVASYKEIAVKNDIWLSLGGVHEAVNILISSHYGKYNNYLLFIFFNNAKCSSF